MDVAIPVDEEVSKLQDQTQLCGSVALFEQLFKTHARLVDDPPCLLLANGVVAEALGDLVETQAAVRIQSHRDGVQV